MINRKIAQEYIDTLAKFPTYQISIYGIHGDLLGTTNTNQNSYDKKIILDFIQSSQLILEQKSRDINSVLIKIFDEDKIACCIEVAAKDNNILPYATALKMSLEIRIKYDKIQTKEQKTLTLQEQLIEQLLMEHPKIDKVYELCEQIHRTIDIPRRLILLIPEDQSVLNTLINMNLYYDTNEDIIGRFDGMLMILKAMNPKKDESETEYTSRYLDFFDSNTSFNGTALIGYTASQYDQVNFFYQNLAWLKQYIETKKTTGKRFYFQNYFDIYMLSQFPFGILQQFFASIQWSPENAIEFIQTTEALIQNNYNIVRSSKDLYVHKNTLMYRLAKYKKEFDIDPVNSEADRTYIKLLNYYLKQVFEGKGGQ